MTHAAQVFGIEQSHKQMGWWYFIWEGLSYISGAIIYAVSPGSESISSISINSDQSCVCRRDYVRVSSIFGVVRTRFFMFVPLQARLGISSVC
jgi:predicted membrane channel-forming protein YqfA (hemolysin III family)